MNETAGLRIRVAGLVLICAPFLVWSKALRTEAPPPRDGVRQLAGLYLPDGWYNLTGEPTWTQARYFVELDPWPSTGLGGIPIKARFSSEVPAWAKRGDRLAVSEMGPRKIFSIARGQNRLKQFADVATGRDHQGRVVEYRVKAGKLNLAVR